LKKGKKGVFDFPTRRWGKHDDVFEPLSFLDLSLRRRKKTCGLKQRRNRRRDSQLRSRRETLIFGRGTTQSCDGSVVCNSQKGLNLWGKKNSGAGSEVGGIANRNSFTEKPISSGRSGYRGARGQETDAMKRGWLEGNPQGGVVEKKKKA